MKKIYIPIIAAIITGILFVVGHASSEKADKKPKSTQNLKVYEEHEIIQSDPERTEKIASPYLLVPYDPEMVNGWNYDENLWIEFSMYQQELYDIIGTEAERRRSDEFYSLLYKYWAAYDKMEADKMRDTGKITSVPLINASEYEAQYKAFKDKIKTLIDTVESNPETAKDTANEAIDIINNYSSFIQKMGAWEATDNIWLAQEGFERGEDKTEDLISSLKWFYGHL